MRYNLKKPHIHFFFIIQLSELSENYNTISMVKYALDIIQLSELSENYNAKL